MITDEVVVDVEHDVVRGDERVPEARQRAIGALARTAVDDAAEHRTGADRILDHMIARPEPEPPCLVVRGHGGW